jgi:CelD/BcsL family acetyltransferase involved in cellulose biosynthesis
VAGGLDKPASEADCDAGCASALATPYRPEPNVKNEFNEFSLKVVRSPDELETYRSDWAALMREVPHPNLYFGPDFLIPNLRLVQDSPFVVAFLYRSRPGGGRSLAAMAAFDLERARWKRPFPHLAPLTNRYVFDSSPLVHPDGAAETWAALLSALANPAHPWQLVEFACEAQLGADGALPSGVDGVDRLLVRTGPSRAGLRKPLTASEFVARRRKSHVRDERRRRKALGALGEVRIERFRGDGEGAEALLLEFLPLESAGWKARAATSVLSRENDSAFFKEVLLIAAKKRTLFWVGLRLDDRLVAASVGFAENGVMVAFKLCFDETLRKFSPGLLLASAVIDAFLDAEDLTLARSGGQTGSWLSRVFLDELPNDIVTLPTRRLLPRLFVRLLSPVRLRLARRQSKAIP